MTIVEINRRLPEMGRIRIGQQKVAKSGKPYPTKLENFRLTSADRSKLEQAAELWGGEVREWQSPAGPQWELFTTSSEIPVMVPPTQMAFSQFFETWKSGGCQRRCDGQWEQISDGPCLCRPNGERECKPHTRLSVILPDLGGLGLWRIDTQGWYGASELAGTIELIHALNILLPAKLRLDQRTAKKDGQTLRFAVPVLDVEIQGRTLMAMTHQQQANVLPQFSAAQELSQDLRGQMMALARQKGLTDAQRHELSEGQSWAEGGGLSNADAQRIMALMRQMPDAKVIEAKDDHPGAITPETNPELFTPATVAEAREALNDPIFDKPAAHPPTGEHVRPMRSLQQGLADGVQPSLDEGFVCDYVFEDGEKCCRPTPHSRNHARRASAKEAV